MNYIKVNPFLPIHGNVDTWLDSLLNSKVGDSVGRDVSKANPNANVNKVEGGYELELAVPGLHKDAFNIEVQENKLIVSANSAEEVQEGSNYIRKEFDYRNFSREFILNEDINRDIIKAEYRDGILHIQLPKVVKVDRTQKIEIT